MTTLIPLFTRHTKEEHADVLADYLPNDDLWKAKKIDGKKLRQLLLGLALSAQKAEDQLETVWEELDPSTTTLFIDDWEKALGIPDDCFPGTGTIEDRRLHVIIKLSSSVQTAADFEALAALLGVTVTVQSGIASAKFPMIFPVLFVGSLKEARFTIVVNFTTSVTEVFPFTFPLTFQESAISIIKCIFSKLKPANCNIIFRET